MSDNADTMIGIGFPPIYISSARPGDTSLFETVQGGSAIAASVAALRIAAPFLSRGRLAFAAGAAAGTMFIAQSSLSLLSLYASGTRMDRGTVAAVVTGSALGALRLSLALTLGGSISLGLGRWGESAAREGLKTLLANKITYHLLANQATGPVMAMLGGTGYGWQDVLVAGGSALAGGTAANRLGVRNACYWLLEGLREIAENWLQARVHHREFRTRDWIFAIAGAGTELGGSLGSLYRPDYARLRPGTSTPVPEHAPPWLYTVGDTPQGVFAAVSSRGGRSTNSDRFAIRAGTSSRYGIADGVDDSFRRGAPAARAAMRALGEGDPEIPIHRLFSDVDTRLKETHASHRACATTATGVSLSPSGRLEGASVGDGQFFIIRRAKGRSEPEEPYPPLMTGKECLHENPLGSEGRCPNSIGFPDNHLTTVRTFDPNSRAHQLLEFAGIQLERGDRFVLVTDGAGRALSLPRLKALANQASNVDDLCLGIERELKDVMRDMDLLLNKPPAYVKTDFNTGSIYYVDRSQHILRRHLMSGNADPSPVYSHSGVLGVTAEVYTRPTSIVDDYNLYHRAYCTRFRSPLKDGRWIDAAGFIYAGNFDVKPVTRVTRDNYTILVAEYKPPRSIRSFLRETVSRFPFAVKPVPSVPKTE